MAYRPVVERPSDPTVIPARSGHWEILQRSVNRSSKPAASADDLCQVPALKFGVGFRTTATTRRFEWSENLMVHVLHVVVPAMRDVYRVVLKSVIQLVRNREKVGVEIDSEF